MAKLFAVCIVVIAILSAIPILRTLGWRLRTFRLTDI